MNKPEILAPAGSRESFMAGLAAGAGTGLAAGLVAALTGSGGLATGGVARDTHYS